MRRPTTKQIDDARHKGFRPEVVFCILNNKKILFVYKEKYNLWQLPQGGIENKETIDKAIEREINEELGKEFGTSCDKNFKVIGEDKIEFPQTTQDARELKTDKGENVFMKGKWYFFATINAADQNIDIRKTEFDAYRWLSYKDALDFSQEIYQRGKRRITLNAIDLLKSFNLL